MSSVPLSAVKRKAESAVKSTRKGRSASVQSARKAPASEMRPKHKRRLSEPELSFTMEEEEDEVEQESVASQDSQLTVAQLQEELRKLGAKVSGRKHELLDRLKDARQGKIQRFGRYDVVITPQEIEEKESFETVPSRYRAPVISKYTQRTGGDVPVVATTTTTTTSLPPAPGSSGEKGGSTPKPSVPVPESGANKPPGATGQGGAPLPPAPLAVIGSPAPAGAPPVDNRTLRIQYQGKSPETIKFDMNDKFVVENVSAMLRNLFPDQKINLDPKLDIEPVYLMDEYSELHVVTLDFLRNCPTANDPPSTIYQARKGPLPLTIEDATLRQYQLWLAILVTIVQFLVVSLVLSPRFVLGSLPQIGSFGLFRALHDWAGFGYPASLFGSFIHALTWLVTCAYLAPAYRVGMKTWFPRLQALRVDAHKASVRFSTALEKQSSALFTRVFGFGSPITARLGLGVRANWMWLITKHYFTTDLVRRTREFLPEGMIVSLICAWMNLSPTTSVVLLGLAFIRPARATISLFWEGEINAEVVLGEMLFSSLAVPGFETNLAATPLVGSPQGVLLLGKDDTKLRLKWNPPNQIPRVSTVSERSYSVGVARYVVISNDGSNSMTFTCPSPARDWMSIPRPEEVVFGLTFAVQMLSIHPGVGSFIAFAVAYSCITTLDAPFKPATITLEGLTPNTEYTITVAAVDDLNRKGVVSIPPFICRTRPKTLFRRLLLASEEVQLNRPPGAPAPPAPGPVVTVNAGAAAPTVSVVGGAPQSVSVVTGPAGAAPAPTAVAVAFAAPPAPPPPAPSTTRGHIRYAGVVWNMTVDDKESELFLRTLRSAMLPDPRKEKFEADFVFSTESKTTHQVVSASFLRTLASTVYDPLNVMAWYRDPLLIAHPAGTRHTFSPGSIYSHMVLSQNNVDRLVTMFVVGSLLSLLYSFTEAQQYGVTSEFWERTYVDAVRTLVQMFVFSNVMVILLQQIRDSYVRLASPIQQRIGQTSQGAIQSALDLLIPDRTLVVLRSVLLMVVALGFCVLALWFNGPLSFTGIFSCVVVLGLTATVLDAATRQLLGDAVQVATAAAFAPAMVFVPVFVPRWSLRIGAALLVAAITFMIVPNNLLALLVAVGAFTSVRFAMQRV